MNKILSLLTLLLVSNLITSKAQQFQYQPSQRWTDKPVSYNINKEFDSSAAVVAVDDRRIEYLFEGQDFLIIYTQYKAIKINTDKGIEMYNKIYIPVYYGQKIIDIKARTVLPNGKIINITADKIKEIEEEGKTFKLFAMEGVEKGAQVEYTYTVKKGVSLFGIEMFQNTTTPVQQAYFTLITPEHLKFDAKGYNGFTVASKDSVIGTKRITPGFAENIAIMPDEKYSHKTPLQQRVEFKLSYNLSGKNDVRMYTWKEFAKKAYDVYTTLTSKETKAIDNFTKSLVVNDNASTANKILAIEDFVKTNISHDEKVMSDDADNLERVVKQKITNRTGMVKLFSYLFNKFNIKYQLVFPSLRDEVPLDEELENWRMADEMVIYFPTTGKYISPTASELRYPYIPANQAATKGLFLKTTTIGTLTTAIGAFGDIEMEPFEKHAHNMEATLTIDEDLEHVTINSKQILLGYAATYYRPIYNYLNKEKQTETSKEIIKSIANSNDITGITVENTAFTDLFDNKPLVINGTLKTTELLEKAGNKILFKVGDLIGKQAEMYQEKKRVLPVELEYPHVLNRIIRFQIPNGYQIKNIADLNIDVAYKDANGVTMGFVSNYSISGNSVEVKIFETYRDIGYPIAAYNNFQKVINAAADFNKVVLILEKK